MAAKINNLPHPELFIGFVSPIGADVQSCVEEFSKVLTNLGYNVVDIKVTEVFPDLQAFVTPDKEIRELPSRARYDSHIAYGNQLRDVFEDDAFLAALSIGRIMKIRTVREEIKSNQFQKQRISSTSLSDAKRSNYCAPFMGDCSFKFLCTPAGELE